MNQKYEHHVMVSKPTGGHERIVLASLRKAKELARKLGGNVIAKAKNITRA